MRKVIFFLRAKHIIGDFEGFFEGVSLGVLILVFSSVAFMMTTKNMLFPKFFDYYFLKVHLHMYLKIKSIKEVTKSKNPGFSYFFCMMMEGSWCGSGSVQTMNGSGSGRSKCLGIWIHNTVRLIWGMRKSINNLRIGKKLNIWFGNREQCGQIINADIFTLFPSTCYLFMRYLAWFCTVSLVLFHKYGIVTYVQRSTIFQSTRHVTIY